MSQMSIILMYAVFGRLFEVLINMVVSTNMQVRLTVTTASKKKIFEVVCTVANQIQEDSRKVYCKKNSKQTPSKRD